MLFNKGLELKLGWGGGVDKLVGVHTEAESDICVFENVSVTFVVVLNHTVPFLVLMYLVLCVLSPNCSNNHAHFGAASGFMQLWCRTLSNHF